MVLVVLLSSANVRRAISLSSPAQSGTKKRSEAFLCKVVYQNTFKTTLHGWFYCMEFFTAIS